MWMHNGGIAEFEKIKRKLQNSLSEELFLFVEGNTDSEWAFALFLSFVCNTHLLAKSENILIAPFYFSSFQIQMQILLNIKN